MELPGCIVECGVFKGASLARFAMLRSLLSTTFAKHLVAFDTYGKFPETEFEPDKEYRDRFVKECGPESISAEQMWDVLAHKRCQESVELVSGDIRDTVPEYATANPHLRISPLNLDTDVYEPSATVLRELYPRIVRGGILLIDDYGKVPGETKAVDEYFAGQAVEIRKFAYCMSPSYVVKN